MSSTPEWCHWYGGPRAWSEGETSFTLCWRSWLFATVDAAKHGYNALNMRNVFWKIPRRERRKKDSGEESCITSPPVHHCTVFPPTPYPGGRDVVHGKVKGGGKQLEVRSQRSDSCETGGKFLPRKFPAPRNQAARRGKFSNWPLANCTSHNRNFTSKAVMCACMSVAKMSLPCSFTLRAFRCVVMSVSRARRASHRGSKNWSA